MLKYRILTAAILVPLVFISIFYTSPLVFRLILGAILLLGAWEWGGLIGFNQIKWRMIYLVFVAAFFYLASYSTPIILIAVGTAGWLWASYQIMTQKVSRFFDIQNPTFVSSVGILALGSCFVSLSFLRDQSVNWVVILLLIIWLADTAAYFAGRQFGKRLLAPNISPKKTWEGVYGALISVSLAVLLWGWVEGLELSVIGYFFLLGWVTVIISIIGDLFESLLKRQAKVKDSGQLLPGHGGLLDRIDSLLAAAPVFALGVLVLRRLVG